MISIIIPTCNRFEIVEETILKAIGIESDVEFEIIVVNDGDTLPFIISHPKLSILKNPKRGVASARNYGAMHAKYDLLFFIDDDMWITEDSLRAIKKLENETFFKTNCAVLNWQYPDVLTSEMKYNKTGRYLLKVNYHTLEGRNNQKFDKSVSLLKKELIGSGSFVLSKEAFLVAGKYNEKFLFQGEDLDFSERLIKAGIKNFIFTKITCYHNQKDRLDLNGYLDREYRGYYSQFKGGILSFHPNRFKKAFYTLLLPFNYFFLFFFKLIPNKPTFDFISFRTIGILSSIVYLKAWHAAFKK